jgi:2,5-diamino-6-(ribosylamino)-4(3H)-pyrimidinone 5'-phosphate reductase
MRPKVSIMSIMSPDGGYVSPGFDVGLYYEVAGLLEADAVLIGADTALEGLAGSGDSSFTESNPAEKVSNTKLPWLFITDSMGRMSGKLAPYRNMEYVRDVVVLISESTSSQYRKYLEDNFYGFIVAGKGKCDLIAALEEISRIYGIKHLRADTVGNLGAALINSSLADEICIIYSPLLIGDASPKAFPGLKEIRVLKLISSRRARGGHYIVRYSLPTGL